MAAADQPGYKALLNVRTELVDKLVTCRADPNVLIVQAKDIGMIGSIQASAAVVPGSESGREMAEQLVNQVLEAAETDDTKVEEFAQLLEENSLEDVAAFLRGKPTERPPVQDSNAPCGEPKQRVPGDGYGGHHSPKLEPVSDSGVDVSQLSSQNGSPDGVRVQPKVVGREGSGIFFEAVPVPGGIVYAEQEHAANLPVASESPVDSVAEDTQPHSEESLAMTGGSSVPVLPETKRLLQNNQELQSQLAEKTRDKDKLQEELKRVSIEKKESEKKLAQKEKELQEKEKQIKALKAEVERLQQALRSEKESNVAEKKRLKEKIKGLERQLKEMEETFYKEKIELMEGKHALELQVQTMCTEEEKLRRQVSEEKLKVAELNTQAIQNRTEQTVNKLVHEHEQQINNITQERDEIRYERDKMRQAIQELKRKNSMMASVEPDTS